MFPFKRLFPGARHSLGIEPALAANAIWGQQALCPLMQRAAQPMDERAGKSFFGPLGQHRGHIGIKQVT